jgi:hypothetical protein
MIVIWVEPTCFENQRLRALFEAPQEAEADHVLIQRSGRAATLL